MYSFKNDYSELGHPQIMEALLKNSARQFEGYGLDETCEAAKKEIAKQADSKNADIHFMSGGTQTNRVFISSVLKGYEAVICADCTHINTHETGAIEAAGNKILYAKTHDGKITPSDIKNILKKHDGEHMVKPKLVVISQTTEWGTVYGKAELIKLKKTCEDNNLLLYIDGARLGCAVECSVADVKIKTVADCSDAFYIGGTKNGAPLGEALVITNKTLKENFRYYIKQNGALLAKGAVLGVIFLELFKDGLFFKLAKQANEAAEKLAECIIKKGYKMKVPPCTNQVFPIFPNALVKQLKKEFSFLVWGDYGHDRSIVRLVTSWATKEDEIERFLASI